MKRFRAAKRTTRAIVVFLGVLAVGSFGLGVYALAAQPLPAPTIASMPANPTNQTSATFTYTDQKKISSFQCSIDSSTTFVACYTGQTSTKSYSGLALGSHTFHVKAISGSDVSAVTSYAWTIDQTAPFVVSINRAGSNPTNASSVSWTATFSESVTGVDVSDFQLANGGLSGPSISLVSGSGAVYAVTANTGTGNGTLGLNLFDNDSIKDLAGNSLNGSGTGTSVLGQGYSIDKTPPPAPVITEHPSDPSPTAESTFAWTESEPGVAIQCSIENGPWQSCTSPKTFTVDSSSEGLHQFAVRAVDGAGNSSSATYSWKVNNVAFSISGNAIGLLYPGVWRPIAITILNPNNFPIYITSLTAGAPASSPANCQPSSNIDFQQSPLSSVHTFPVAANSTASLPVADRPQVQLKNLPTTNQDSCKDASFTLTYSGTATK
jgi:hypothetical protein